MKPRVGHKLLQIREERKLTQSEMAELLNLSTSAYSRYERDETSPEITDLLNFAEVLKVPIYTLLPDTMSINNSSSHSEGGGIIVGTLNNYHNHYYDSSEPIKKLEQRISQLESENELLKRKVAD